MKITPSQVYETFAKLVLHSENISWNRFNNFLLVNSILILAWVEVFASNQSSSVQGRIVMLFICVFGSLSGVAWAGLGKRGRHYLNEYKKKIKYIESLNSDWWEKEIPKELRPYQVDLGPGSYDTSTFLVGLGPYFFTIIYIVLFIVSLPCS